MKSFISASTAMAAAFEKTKITRQNRATHGHIIMRAATNLKMHAGERKIPEWNAHLKLKTYKKLVNEGVMA